MNQPVSALATASTLTELWSPRVVGELDDSYIKVAKLQGELGWHAHAGEDEMFFVLSGRLRIELEDGSVTINAGEFFVVPRAVRHNPVAEHEVCVMLVEKKSTSHTGELRTALTRSLDDQLRPL